MPAPFIVSEPYSIRRAELAYATAEVYFRTYWWFILGIPVAGIAILFALPMLRIVGGLMVLWPISIPARAVLISGKTYRRLGAQTVARVGENEAFIEPEGQTPVRIHYNWVRKVMKSGQLFILVGPRGAFTAIRSSAFNLEQRTEIDALFRAKKLL
jgi:hypothetical protein